VLIDVHQHFNKSYYPDREAYLEELLQTAEQYGVDRFCVNGLGEPYENFTDEDTEYAFKRYPEKIIGFAYIDLDDDTPAKVADCAARGFRGVKIINPKRNYDDDAYFQIYEAIAEHRLVPLFHTGILAPSPLDRIKHTCSDRMRPLRLEAIARTFPELPVIGAHLGVQWYDEALTAANVNPNLYFDTSAMAVDALLKKNPEHLPVEKLVFATDCLPRDFNVPYENTRRLLDGWQIDAETRRGIMGETAARLLGLSS